MKRLKPQGKKFYQHIRIGRRGEQISATQTCHRRGLGVGNGSLGAEAPCRWAVICKFLEKNGCFNAIWITFRTFSESFERTKFLRFESQLNKSLPLLQVKSKTRLKCRILGLNFVTWPGQENQGKLLSAIFLALNHSLKDLPLKIFVLS